MLRKNIHIKSDVLKSNALFPSIDTIDWLPFKTMLDRYMSSGRPTCRAQIDVVGSYEYKSIHRCSWWIVTPLFVMVVHESLCSEQLNWALFFRKILHVLKILQFHLFPAVTMILRSIFSHWRHLSDSTPTIKKASNIHWCSRRKYDALRRGVKTFGIWRTG